MATAAEAKTEATTKGFRDLPCLKCGDTDALSLDLMDLETCNCSSCDETFELSEVREFIAKWQRLLAWVDLAPAND